MTLQNYPRCLANTLREEGGWTNDPRDPGGPTMRGVIQREYTKFRADRRLPLQSVGKISEEELQTIYRENYWKPMNGDLWPKGPDQVLFDIAVNSGIGRAPQIMRAALGNPTGGIRTLALLAAQSEDRVGIVKRACARRGSFYRRLGTFPVFGRGWMARNARMEAIGVKMALETEKRVTGGLQNEHAKAELKSKRSGKGAAGVGGSASAGGAAITQTDVSAWDWSVWTALGLTAVGAIALTLSLVWLWQKHGERAKAYAAALRGELETELSDILIKIKDAIPDKREVA